MVSLSFRQTYFTYILIYSKTAKKHTVYQRFGFTSEASSGLTSGAGRQYVKACPIRGSVGSFPCLDSCSPSSWSISPPLYVFCLPALSDSRSITLTFSQSITWFSLQTRSVIADLLQILAALVFSALVKIPVMLSTPLRCSFTLAPSGLPVSPTQTCSQF